MTRVAKDGTRVVGGTPSVRPGKVRSDLAGGLVAKLESFNPWASVTDRIGPSMIEAAERAGRVKQDTVIVEPTSGNTGIALRGFRPAPVERGVSA